MALRRQENARVTFEKKLMRSVGTVRLHIGARQVWNLGTVTVEQFAQVNGNQQSYPQLLAEIGDRRYWQFQDRFYWESDGLTAQAVHALLVTQRQRQAQRVERAQQMVAMGAQPRRSARGTVPEDVKHLVWQRDGGACRLCGATVELQFDHVIPVSFGGASTPENLQVLCGPCNRRKSAAVSLTDGHGDYPW